VKKVEAIIKPFKLDEVEEAMRAAFAQTYMPLEIIVSDAILPQVVEAIEKSAKTGRIGDGKIFVTQVEAVIRIRTGETGEDAL